MNNTFNSLTQQEIGLYFILHNKNKIILLDPYNKHKVLYAIASTAPLNLNTEYIAQLPDYIQYHFAHYYGTKIGNKIQHYNDIVTLSLYNHPADINYYYWEYIKANKLTNILANLTVQEILQIYLQLIIILSHTKNLKLDFTLSNIRVVKLDKIVSLHYDLVKFDTQYVVKIIDTKSTNLTTSTADIINQFIGVVNFDKQNAIAFLLLNPTHLLIDIILTYLSYSNLQVPHYHLHSKRITRIISLFSYFKLLSRYCNLANNNMLYIEDINLHSKNFITDVLVMYDLYKQLTLLPTHIVLVKPLLEYKKMVAAFLNYVPILIATKRKAYNYVYEITKQETPTSKNKLQKLQKLQDIYQKYITYAQL